MAPCPAPLHHPTVSPYKLTEDTLIYTNPNSLCPLKQTIRSDPLQGILLYTSPESRFTLKHKSPRRSNEPGFQEVVAAAAAAAESSALSAGGREA